EHFALLVERGQLGVVDTTREPQALSRHPVYLGQSPQIASLALIDLAGQDEIVALPEFGSQRCERRDQVAYILTLIESPGVQHVWTRDLELGAQVRRRRA